MAEADLKRWEEVVPVDETFFRECFRIVSKPGIDGTPGCEVPFVLNASQRPLVAAIRKYRRVVGLKYRQAGWSTAVAAIGQKDCLTKPNQRGVIMAHDRDATMMLMRRTDYLYEHLPEWFPRLRRDIANANQKSYPDLNSSLFVGTAGEEVPLRAETLTFFHGSEVSRWREKSFAEVVGGLEALPLGAIEVFETTGNRYGDHFHRFYRNVKEANAQGDFSRYALFCPWYQNPEYSIPADTHLQIPARERGKLELTEEEQELVERFGLTEGQLRFRRYKIRSYEQTGAAEIEGVEARDLFNREYPCDDVVAFVVAGDSPFDKRALQRMLGACTEPPWKEGALWTWRQPKVGERSLLAADPAGGSPKGDYAAAHVLGLRDLEQKAVLRGRLPPDLFGQELARLGMRYNRAVIVVEANTWGQEVLRVLHALGYPSIFLDRTVDAITGKVTLKEGVTVTSSNKPLLVANLASHIRQGNLILHDQRTVEELLGVSIKRQARGDSYEAATGHDDLAASLWVGLWAWRDVVAEQATLLVGADGEELLARSVEYGY